MGLILVVNLHGAINSSAPVRKALNELKVARKFSASVVTDDAQTVGMLRLCKDYVSWTAMKEDLLTVLLKKRGRVSAAKTLDDSSLRRLGFKKYDDMAARMFKEQVRLSSMPGILPYFRLAPPKGGFKRSMRRQFTEKGILGNNPGLEEIVKRMI